ncbi:MAG: hypothetical protein V2B18_05510 [Pseudomonadota bacterium]
MAVATPTLEIPIEAEKKLRVLEDEIRALAEKGDLPAARRIISPVPRGLSESLDKWREVLAPPVARVTGSASGRDLRLDSEWLEKNSWQYVGQWVALKNGELLDSGPSRAALRAILKERGDLSGAFLVKIEDEG